MSNASGGVVDRPCGSCSACLSGDSGSCDVGSFNIFKGSGAPLMGPDLDLVACDELLSQLGVDPSNDSGEHDKVAGPAGAGCARISGGAGAGQSITDFRVTHGSLVPQPVEKKVAHE